MNYLLLVAFVLIILWQLQRMYYIHNDHFLQSLSLIADEKPNHLNIIVPSYINGKEIHALSEIKGVTMTKEEDKNNMYVTDAFTFNKNNKKNHKIFAVLPLQRVLFIIAPINKFSVETLMKPYIVIGYRNLEEYTLLQTLNKVIKDSSPSPPFLLKQIGEDISNIDANTFDSNGIDGLAMFASMESDDLKQVSGDFKMNILDYGEHIDMEKLQVAFPYARKQNIDFALYFKQFQGKMDSVKTVISFDVLLHGRGNESMITYELKNILSNLNNPELLNYYEQYFSLYNISQNYIQTKNNNVSTRFSRQILEQFSPHSHGVTFNMNKNIDGFYDSNNKKFIINSHIIDNIPMKVNTVIVLENQIREEENGQYVVETVKRNLIVMSRLSQYTLATNGQDGQDGQFDPRYRCYDNPDIMSKGLCESRFDEIGRMKRKQTYWDRPCETNKECPFYQSNKNYKNYRGGCIDGRCEMPVGVKQVAYRLFDPLSQPLCHGCMDISNPYCCEEQKNKEKYPHLNSPDYAFPLDTFERRQ